MCDGHNNAVVLTGINGIDQMKAVLRQRFFRIGPSIVHVNGTSILPQLLYDINHPGVADIWTILFESEPQQNLRAVATLIPRAIRSLMNLDATTSPIRSIRCRRRMISGW